MTSPTPQRQSPGRPPNVPSGSKCAQCGKDGAGRTIGGIFLCTGPGSCFNKVKSERKKLSREAIRAGRPLRPPMGKQCTECLKTGPGVGIGRVHGKELCTGPGGCLYKEKARIEREKVCAEGLTKRQYWDIRRRNAASSRQGRQEGGPGSSTLPDNVHNPPGDRRLEGSLRSPSRGRSSSRSQHPPVGPADQSPARQSPSPPSPSPARGRPRSGSRRRPPRFPTPEGLPRRELPRNDYAPSDRHYYNEGRANRPRMSSRSRSGSRGPT